MIFLGPKLIGNFKPRKNPNKKLEPKAASKRPGMDRAHLAMIRTLPSCISGRQPCDPHHLRVKGERGVGLKATDKWAVPLTRDEHDEVHKVGSRKEEAWFAARGISNCYELASALWAAGKSRDLMLRVLEAHRGGT